MTIPSYRQVGNYFQIQVHMEKEGISVVKVKTDDGFKLQYEILY